MPGWLSFLVLTIAGERLELARVRLLRRANLVSCLATVALVVSGLIVSLFALPAGLRVSSLALLLFLGNTLWAVRRGARAGRTLERPA